MMNSSGNATEERKLARYPLRESLSGQRKHRGGFTVTRRMLAVLSTGVILVGVLLWSNAERADVPAAQAKLPRAIGAIHPRISPDGKNIAFSYQGEIWTAPRTGGTMTMLTASEGLDTEPTWSPDGKRIAFIRGPAVKLVEFPSGT